MPRLHLNRCMLAPMSYRIRRKLVARLHLIRYSLCSKIAEVAPESFRVGAQVENVRAGVAPESFLVGAQVVNDACRGCA